MERDLDGILSALREAGTFDSDGQFSLDEQRMRDKMVRFQLPRPEMWVTTFVAAAVAAGAAQMEITEFGGSWMLRWNGRTLDAEGGRAQALEQLDAALRAPTPGGGFIGALSRAVQALAVLRPALVKISSGTLRAEIRGSEVKTDIGPSDNQTRIEINPGGSWTQLRALLNGGSDERHQAERMALAQSCAYAPLEMKVGLDVLNREFDPGPVLAARYLEGTDRGFSVLRPRSTVWQKRLDNRDVTALLWIPLEPTARRVQSIIVDGVEFAAQDPLPFPDISYIASVRGLSLDLSLTAFIRDEKYEAAWALLLEEAQVLYASNEGVGAPPGRRYQWLRDSLPYFQGTQRMSMMARLLSAAMEVDTDVSLTHAASLVEELAPTHPEVASVGRTLRTLLTGRIRHGEAMVPALVGCVKAEIRMGTPPPTVLPWLAVLCALAGEPARARVLQDEVRPARTAAIALRIAHETRYALFMRVGGSAQLARETFEKNLAELGDDDADLRLRNLQYLAETELALGEYPSSCTHFEAALRVASESAKPDATLQLTLLEGLAEAQQRAGHPDEAAHTLEVALDSWTLQNSTEVETLTRCARRWSRLHRGGGGIVGFARGLLGIGRKHEGHYREMAGHPPKLPKLAQAEALLPDHAFSALTFCEEALAEVVEREGIGASNYCTVLAMLAYVHREIGKGNMGDIYTAKIHLARIYWRLVASDAPTQSK